MGLWAAPPAIDGISAAIDGPEPVGPAGWIAAVFQDIACPGDCPAGRKVVDFDNMAPHSARLGLVPSISGKFRERFDGDGKTRWRSANIAKVRVLSGGLSRT